MLSGCLGACAVGELGNAGLPATTDQHGVNMQGINMQGINMQGINMQGINMQGFELGGASLSGAGLVNVRVEHGELVAERAGVTLRGTGLVGAHLFADGRNLTVVPPVTVRVEYRITAIAPENAAYDPTHTGTTFLYTLEQLVDNTAWQPACSADADGLHVAIPLAATWDEHGDKIVSSSLFTLGCTTGVIAKCYRWGYRPWITGYGDMAALHWTCTRLARADYCGDGVPHTYDGTEINVWDLLPAPGPIQQHGAKSPQGMHFEAGWNTTGAVCLSKERWKDAGSQASLCPNGQRLPTHRKGTAIRCRTSSPWIRRLSCSPSRATATSTRRRVSDLEGAQGARLASRYVGTIAAAAAAAGSTGCQRDTPASSAASIPAACAAAMSVSS
jgi:hypothetical protein